MSAGLDSIAATELTSDLSAEFGKEMSPTMFFDHPTIASIAQIFSAHEDGSQVA